MSDAKPGLSKTTFLVGSERAAFGQVIYPPGGTCGPRIQQDFQLVLVYEGVATVFVDRVAQRIEAGQAGLLQPGHAKFIQFSTTTSTHHSWCALAPDAVNAELKQQLTACAINYAVSTRLQTFIELGLSLSAAPGASRDLAIQTLAGATLGEYALSAALPGEAPLLPPVVEHTKRLTETNFAADWTLATLAHSVCVTPTYLVTLFRQHMGITPVRYLWLVRTRQGVHLLRETGLTIAEIANRVGFSSPFHFSRLVKQHYGLSPRRLRAQTWQTS